MILRQRIVGSLVAGALGDALGAPFEGQGPDPWRQLPAHPTFITDDTELTLATCEAIVKSGDTHAQSIAESFAHWHRSGRVHGAGAGTTKALRDLAHGAHWALAGARGDRAAGSGAAMRVAPLAFLTRLDDADDRTRLRDICRITHHHDEAYAAAVAVVAAIQTAMNGLTGSQFLSAVIQLTPDSVTRDRLNSLRDLNADLACAQDLKTIVKLTGSSGYAADVVPLALTFAAHCRELETIFLSLIRLGGDTDTTAAIAGQIVGCAVGIDALPRSLTELPVDLGSVHRTAHQFADFVAEPARP